MAKRKKDALAQVGDGAYKLMDPNAPNIAEIVAENTGGQGVSQFDLDKVTVPGSGGKQWTIPTADGEQDVPEIIGVVIAQRWVRAYWQQGLDEGQSGPPDCSSDDCVVGHGDPGGLCDDCPFREFGTAKGGKGRGQACKHVHLLFVMTRDNYLPLVIALPPTSHGHGAGSRKYFMRLAGFGKPFYSVETSFTLEQQTNPDGRKYSRAVLKKASDLPDEAVAVFQKAGEALSSHVRNVRAADVAAKPTD